MLGIIAGTGFYDMSVLENKETKVIETPYGEATVVFGTIAGAPAVFLARHQADHSVPPHKINYRANIYALHKVGVDRIIGINAVGSTDLKMGPGSLVLIDDFVDFTHGREHTFCDGVLANVGHIDVSAPYCLDMQNRIKMAALAEEVNMFYDGIYVCTQGPRFETRAEIRFYASQGWNIVGMTAVPEVQLANELGICYCGISVVTNYACGIAGEINHELITDLMANSKAEIEKILVHFNADYPQIKSCNCHEMVDWK